MEVNIEAVMDEIRAEIKEKGYTQDMLSFKEVTGISPSCGAGPAEDLRGTVIYLSDTCFVAESVPITGNAIVRFIKKLIRKLMRFYVKPIVMSQNEFNSLSARAIADVNGYIGEKTEKGSLEYRLSELETKIEALTRENERLSERIKELAENGK